MYVNALLFFISFYFQPCSALFYFHLFVVIYPHLISSFHWLLCAHCSWRDGAFTWSRLGDIPVPDPLMSQFMTAHKVSPMDEVFIRWGTFHFSHYVFIK